MMQDGPIDYAVFQLSPRRSRCELLISSNGNTEKLASGLVKPFVAQLKVAEDQFMKMVQHIKLELGKKDHGKTWFTRGTMERFVRFVSTPEILELAGNFDAEMSQLEAARKIYLQGQESPHSTSSGEDEAGVARAADATKKELLRAIDVRLAAVRQQLATAYARACTAGFHRDSVSELMLFADFFGADRLNEACAKFLSLCHRRPDQLLEWRTITNEQIRSSHESDMSIDDTAEDLIIPMEQNLINQNSSFMDQESHASRKGEINLDQSKTSISDQLKSFSSFVSDRKNDGRRIEENDKKDQPSIAVPVQSSQTARRLSVQDRINLFENKQKETVGSGSGSKPVVSKSAELRRMSSDVSAAPSAVEKAVSRRWSGPSDMRIDFNVDKRDYGHSPESMTSSTSVSQAEGHAASTPSEDTHHKGYNDCSGSTKFDGKSLKAEIIDTELENQSDLSSNTLPLDKAEGSNVREISVDGLASPQPRSSVTEQQRESNCEEKTEQKAESLLGSGDGNAKEQVESEVQLMGFAQEINAIGFGDKAASVSSAFDALGNSDHSSRKNETGRVLDHDRLKGTRASRSKIRGLHGHSRSFSGQLEGPSVLKLRETPEKVSGGGKLAEQPRERSYAGEFEGAPREVGSEDSSMQKNKPSKTVPVGSELIKRVQVHREDGAFSSANSKPTLSSRKVSESLDSPSIAPSTQSDQPHRARQSKGNQELNDELKMKADELEKLFAEHKLRASGDQSGSARRSKPADSMDSLSTSKLRKSSLTEAAPGSLPEKSTVPEAKGRASSISSFTTPLKLADLEESSNTLGRNLSDLSYSDKSRGKFYEKYTKRRDAKLKEEWGSKGAEKEAKLKAMHDKLEESTAEMKAKFAGSAERQQSLQTACQSADRVRSFSWRSNVTKQQMDLNQNEKKEVSMFSELDSQDDVFSEPHGGVLVSRSIQTKMPLPSHDLDSSNTHSAAISRSSVKPLYTSGRRKTPSDNPLAQSVPNFSEFKKENTKPSSGSGVSKVAPRTQVRSSAQSRSINEATPLVKEVETKQMQSVWKGSTDPGDCAEFSSSKFKGSTLEGNSAMAARKVRDMRLKTAPASEAITDEGFVDVESMADHMLIMTGGGDDDEPETVAVPNLGGTMHDGKTRMSAESDYSLKSGFGNDDSLTSLSWAHPALAADLAASVSLKYQAGDLLRDSPNESPLSWNSRVHHLFGYPHDASDIDSSVDSPVGSPASWNSHILGQTEGDSARMRKKWGSASNPLFAANTSHGHSHKDATKGFKRLLKFGRKNRGTESLVDWISVTTSEGDDDTEDGRDYANRSLEDLRKSRMGFQQGHPSDENLNENELLNENVETLHSSIPAPPANFKLQEDLISGSSLKAPKFFFSLSTTFRSKGSDAKPR
ncbi:hypothetical protein MLD38_004792 [Melastoma candidum]|uniref:Uncharacterized protein n=1 Tax=Melastoma candidum TaxID=119954 RepID=A0ACB9SA51_9MYRT|nr:hypothetical protein MLD38_004792 [Melastoma candidum]